MRGYRGRSLPKQAPPATIPKNPDTTRQIMTTVFLRFAEGFWCFFGRKISGKKLGLHQVMSGMVIEGTSSMVINRRNLFNGKRRNLNSRRLLPGDRPGREWHWLFFGHPLARDKLIDQVLLSAELLFWISPLKTLKCDPPPWPKLWTPVTPTVTRKWDLGRPRKSAQWWLAV